MFVDWVSKLFWFQSEADLIFFSYTVSKPIDCHFCSIDMLFAFLLDDFVALRCTLLFMFSNSLLSLVS